MIWYNKSKIVLEAKKDDEEPESTDYTDLGDQSDEPEDGAGDDTTDGSDEPDTSEDEPDTDAPSDDTEDDGTEDDATDYTVDSEDTTADGGDDDTTSDDSDTAEDDTTSEEPEIDESEKESNRRLHNDFQELYYSCKSMIARLSALSRNNVLVNQTIAQIISNISIIEKQIYEYLIFNFGKKKYSANLLSYNNFISALQLNVEMLRKINVFTPDLQNN